MKILNRIIYLFTPKYALFAGHRYYPGGGACDFRAFGTIDELKELYKSKADKWSMDSGSYPDPWGQIVDVETMTVLHETDEDHVWSELPMGQKPTSQHG